MYQLRREAEELIMRYLTDTLPTEMANACYNVACEYLGLDDVANTHAFYYGHSLQAWVAIHRDAGQRVHLFYEKYCQEEINYD